MKHALFVAGMATAMVVGGVTIASAATPFKSASSVTGTEIAPLNSWPSAVNDRGDVAGDISVDNTTHAYYWHAGKLTNLGFLLGGDYTTVDAVGYGGEVVGYSGSYAGTVHAFAWTGGRMTDLGSLGGNSFAYAVNDKGQIIGDSQNTSGVTVPVIWRNGRMTTLPGLGGTFSYTSAQNDAGEVVGYSELASGEIHAVIWRNGKLVDLGPGMARAIDESGQVLVQVEIVGQPLTAFLWDNGSKTTLPAGVMVTGLNDEGQVVGTYYPNGAATAHGFVWHDGKLTDLGVDSPVAINDRGQILAYAWVNNSQLGMVLDHGKMITLAPASGSDVSPSIINENGLVAGVTANQTALWQVPAGE